MAKMPARGVCWYDCAVSVGPMAKKRHWKSHLEPFVSNSGRAKMGEREPPFVHSENAEATRHRGLRRLAPVAYAAIKSQLIIARRQLRKNIANPAKQVILDRFPSRNANFEPGDHVAFVRPGPRRHAVPGRGEVMCFPDKKQQFVAIDRSTYLHRGKLLANIDVIPRQDAWKA